MLAYKDMDCSPINLEQSIRLNKRLGVALDRTSQILVLFNKGLDTVQIAQQLGVSVATVYRDLKSIGIKPKGRW